MVRYKAVTWRHRGAGALMAQAVKEAQVVAYEDLGPEAIRRLIVHKLPAVVVNDVLETTFMQRARRRIAGLSGPRTIPLERASGGRMKRKGSRRRIFWWVVLADPGLGRIFHHDRARKRSGS